MGRVSIQPSARQHIVDSYLAGTAGTAISRQLGCHSRTIYRILRENGVNVRHTWTAAERAGLSGRGAVIKKLPVDDSAFSCWTEESEYWAGFLCADGHFNTWQRHTSQVAVTLHAKDIGHLYKLAAFVKSPACSVKIINVKATNRQPQRQHASLRFSSAKIRERLRLSGISKPSLERAPVPDLARSRHFWRGVVDGDGSVLELKRGDATYAAIFLCGGEFVINKFIEFASAIVTIPAKAVQRRGKIFTVGFSHRKARLILALLYSDSTVALERKLNTARSLLE